MISKAKLNKLLNLCITNGSDFAEIFLEDTKSNNYELVGGVIENITTNYVYGIGIRVIKGEIEYYGYTNEISYDNLVRLVEKLTAGLSKNENTVKITLKTEKNKNAHKVLISPERKPNLEKISYMKKVYESCKNHSEEITQVVINLFDKQQDVIIANTNGKY
ncbi:MAG: DNA gyrase modulator, partial [Bacilli bacterium]|nr:DNA gyrase modulator [Bacilli bacterium]